MVMKSSQIISRAVSANNPGLKGSSISNRTIIPPMNAKGPPIRPKRAMRFGTAPERNIRYPRSIPLPNPEQNCGPRRNVQSWNTTNKCLIIRRSFVLFPGLNSARNVMTDIRLITPVRISKDSTILEAT